MWILAAVWCLAFTLSHLPRVPVGSYFSWEDKLFHCVGFFGLGSLLYWALPTQMAWPRKVTWCMAILLGYALLDETTQPYFGRTCSPWDGLADMMGAACAMAFCTLATWWVEQRAKTWNRAAL